VFDRGRLTEHGTHEQLLAVDGQYARMVKLQTAVSSATSVDALLQVEEERQVDKEIGRQFSDTEHENVFQPRWLVPGDANLRAAARGAMEVALCCGRPPDRATSTTETHNCAGAGDPRATAKCGAFLIPDTHHLTPTYRGVFAVNLFPATNPDDYISLRVWNRDGGEEEIGILRRLNEWPAEVQQLVRAALDRRYYLQTITGIDELRLELGHLSFRVDTAHGPRKFTMRWSQSQVQDFGERGKVLLDLDDNRYLVPDVEALPPRQRDLFQRYVYW
jgi:hypothetical protein